eukprot:m.8473 g.8473  ORF g.8473 m.8473 type:complete len:944 (-) comp3904_c0_seq1:68-2899(-)
MDDESMPWLLLNTTVEEMLERLKRAKDETYSVCPAPSDSEANYILSYNLGGRIAVVEIYQHPDGFFYSHDVSESDPTLSGIVKRCLDEAAEAFDEDEEREVDLRLDSVMLWTIEETQRWLQEQGFDFPTLAQLDGEGLLQLGPLELYLKQIKGPVVDLMMQAIDELPGAGEYRTDSMRMRHEQEKLNIEEEEKLRKSGRNPDIEYDQVTNPETELETNGDGERPLRSALRKGKCPYPHNTRGSEGGGGHAQNKKRVALVRHHGQYQIMDAETGVKLLDVTQDELLEEHLNKKKNQGRRKKFRIREQESTYEPSTAQSETNYSMYSSYVPSQYGTQSQYGQHRQLYDLHQGMNTTQSRKKALWETYSNAPRNLTLGERPLLPNANGLQRYKMHCTDTRAVVIDRATGGVVHTLSLKPEQEKTTTEKLLEQLLESRKKSEEQPASHHHHHHHHHHHKEATTPSMDAITQPPPPVSKAPSVTESFRQEYQNRRTKPGWVVYGDNHADDFAQPTPFTQPRVVTTRSSSSSTHPRKMKESLYEDPKMVRRSTFEGGSQYQYQPNHSDLAESLTHDVQHEAMIRFKQQNRKLFGAVPKDASPEKSDESDQHVSSTTTDQEERPGSVSSYPTSSFKSSHVSSKNVSFKQVPSDRSSHISGADGIMHEDRFTSDGQPEMQPREVFAKGLHTPGRNTIYDEIDPQDLDATVPKPTSNYIEVKDATVAPEEPHYVDPRDGSEVFSSSGYIEVRDGSGADMPARNEVLAKPSFEETPSPVFPLSTTGSKTNIEVNSRKESSTTNPLSETHEAIQSALEELLDKDPELLDKDPDYRDSILESEGNPFEGGSETEDAEWFKGNMTTEAAKSFISGADPGEFLVYTSPDRNDYLLHVAAFGEEERIINTRIEYLEGTNEVRLAGFRENFGSIQDLIYFYQSPKSSSLKLATVQVAGV